jgi:hypothetical protein
MADETLTESSPSPETAAPVPQAESTAPSPSPASEPTPETSGQQAKDTLLDAVLKVVPATTEQDVLADSETKASPETPADKPEDGKTEAPEDDDDAEPPADAGNPILRKKIQKLLTKNHNYKKQVQELETQVTQFRPQAEIGSQLEGFCKQHDLSGDDVVYGLGVMAALRRGDWKTFYEAAAQPMRHAQEYLGYAVPRDLREKVSQGQMTEAMAKEYARLRMDQHQSENVRIFEQQNYAAQMHQQTQAQVENSVNAFEAKLAASDPDYRRKAPFMKQAVQAKLLENGGHIQTVEEALTITKAAYDEVNTMLRKLQPQPHATSKAPNGNGSTRSARAEPTSLYEAALQGLERARNGAAT